MVEKCYVFCRRRHDSREGELEDKETDMSETGKDVKEQRRGGRARGSSTSEGGSQSSSGKK